MQHAPRMGGREGEKKIGEGWEGRGRKESGVGGVGGVEGACGAGGLEEARRGGL